MILYNTLLFPRTLCTVFDVVEYFPPGYITYTGGVKVVLIVKGCFSHLFFSRYKNH